MLAILFWIHCVDKLQPLERKVEGLESQPSKGESSHHKIATWVFLYSQRPGCMGGQLYVKTKWYLYSGIVDISNFISNITKILKISGVI